jgi:hypothetical protein
VIGGRIKASSTFAPLPVPMAAPRTFASGSAKCGWWNCIQVIPKKEKFSIPKQMLAGDAKVCIEHTVWILDFHVLDHDVPEQYKPKNDWKLPRKTHKDTDNFVT